MFRRSILFSAAMGVGVATILSGTFLLAQQQESPNPDDLLPNNTSIYLRCYAGADVDAAWKETAAYIGVTESGLDAFVMNLFTSGFQALQRSGEMPPEFQGMEAFQPVVSKFLDHIRLHGIALGADVRLLAGELTIVLPDAAGTDLADELDVLVRTFAEQSELAVVEKEIEGRSVATINIQPQMYLSWWEEGPHLMIVGNQLGPNPAVRRAAGRSDGLAKSPRFEKFRSKATYTLGGQLWVDAQLLIKLLPQGIPEVTQIMQTLGLESFEGVNVAWGYEGKALRTDYDLLLTESRKGIFDVFGGPALDIKALPKLPNDVDSVYASSLDMVKVYDVIMRLVDGLAPMAAGVGAPPFSVEQLTSQLDASVGFSLRDDLLASLGNTAVVYNVPTDGPFGILGISAAIAVKDRAKLTECLDVIAEQVGQMDPNVFVEKRSKDGVDFYLGGYAGAPMPIAPTVAVSDDWIVLAIFSPSPAQRFFRLQASDAKGWDFANAFQTLPSHKGEVTGLIYADPKKAVESVISILPMLGALVRNMDPSFEVDLLSTPDIDKIMGSVFPGTAVTTNDSRGVHLSSRYSLPLTNPELGLSSGGGLASTGVIAALLAPAVNSARDAAQRTRDANNLKQIGLGFHVYSDAADHVPVGTDPSARQLPIERRLSWLATIAPYLEAGIEREDLAFDEPWDSPKNRETTSQPVDQYLNPVYNDPNSNHTHHVGMAGVGRDAATLPINDPRAGMFGYDRIVRFRDVRDGLSNSIAVIGVEQEKAGPWGQGGPSTVRGLTEKPYIHGPDGFGSNREGVQVLMGDGSVRMISSDVDPEVLERLSTINGGEQVPRLP